MSITLILIIVAAALFVYAFVTGPRETLQHLGGWAAFTLLGLLILAVIAALVLWLSRVH